MLDISPDIFTVTQFYITYSNSNMSILYILKLFFLNIFTTTAETICNSCKKTKKIAPCTCIILAGLPRNMQIKHFMLMDATLGSQKNLGGMFFLLKTIWELAKVDIKR